MTVIRAERLDHESGIVHELISVRIEDGIYTTVHTTTVVDDTLDEALRTFDLLKHSVGDNWTCCGATWRDATEEAASVMDEPL